MKTAWTNGLSPEKKEEMRKDFYASSLIRDRLTKILNDKIDARRKGSTLESSYDNPNWALLKADSTGYERALLEVISLIFNEKVKKD